MAAKIIQVPIDPDLLKRVNRACKKQGKNRSEFVREACRKYLAQLQEAEWDRQYVEAYRRMPETNAFAESIEKMAGEVFPTEKW